MSDVELYFLKFNATKQERLHIIRSAVKEQYPDSAERLYYGMPTVDLNGKIILHYAGYKNHVSLIVGYALSEFLQEKYPQYRYTRATVIFPDNEPLPEDFIKEVCGMLGNAE